MSQVELRAVYPGVAGAGDEPPAGAMAADAAPSSSSLLVNYDDRTSDVSIVCHDRIGRLAPGDPQPLFFMGTAGKDSAKFIKFSPDLKYVCIAMSGTVFEVLTVEGKGSVQQDSRKREEIIGVFWTSSDNIVVITRAGFELFQVSAPCKLRSIKSFSQTINWFTYYPTQRLLVAGIGPNEVCVWAFRPQQVVRVSRLSLEPLPRGCEGSPNVPRGHVGVLELYGNPHLVQLTYRGPWGGPVLSLWNLAQRASQLPRRVSLPPARRLPFDEARFQVLDNVIAVHLLREQTTILVDTRSEQPVVPLSLKALPRRHADAPDGGDPEHHKLYTPGDVFIGDCGVLNTKNGAYWELKLDLQQISMDWENKEMLVQFLQRRSNGKAEIVDVVKTMIAERRPLTELGNVMDRLNAVLKRSEETAPPQKQIKHQSGSVLLRLPDGDQGGQLPESLRVAAEVGQSSTDSTVIDTGWYVVVTQSDMFHRVFVPLEEERLVTSKFSTAVLMDYIRSLCFNSIKVEPFLYARLIEILVTEKNFFQLQQVLQYYVISDSVHIACQLLSLENAYPAAYQMALDMLKRLGENDHILEVLLAKKNVIATLRFLQGRSMHVPPSRVLEVAMTLDDPIHFFSAYKFFEQRGELTAEHVKFAAFFRTRFPEAVSSSS